jgi:RNA polymerase sigma-70 factor (ECF subfamily)
MTGEAMDNADIPDIQSSLNGDEDAYWRIVQRHGPAIQRQMRNFTRDEHLVEELTQDVFVEAYTGLKGYRGDAPLAHWLARIATRVGCRFWKRRDRRKVEVPLDRLPDIASREHVARDPGLAADILFAMFAALPDDDRLAMTLMYMEQCPHEEIGRRIGCGTELVAVRIHRAREKLRKLGAREPWKGKLACLIS